MESAGSMAAMRAVANADVGEAIVAAIDAGSAQDEVEGHRARAYSAAFRPPR